MTTITDDEREAREWLRMRHSAHARTILALLDRPALPRPEEVPDDVVDAMVASWYAGPCDSVGMRDVIGVLHDHYAQPPAPVKRIELYAVVTPSGDVISVYDKDDGIEPRVRNGGRIVRLVEDRDGR